jgi:hypothetical protein
MILFQNRPINWMVFLYNSKRKLFPKNFKANSFIIFLHKCCIIKFLKIIVLPFSGQNLLLLKLPFRQ